MTEDALHESAIAGGANAFQNNMLGGSQDTPLNGDKEKAEEAKEPAMTADIELQGLALSSAITELGYALEAVSTLIFEIQEIRHTAANTSQNDDTNAHASQVDSSLLKLEEQLEATNKEVDSLQTRLNTYLETQPAGVLLAKWDEALTLWQKLQKEAEDMREELVEDKYLTVYRTVSRQAEDMMQSLEKIFAQCDMFVHETYKCRRIQPKPTTEELQVQLNTFVGLHKSLHQKTKYYIPSCEKVLKVIDSGIAQQRRCLNGEILRSHADMKLRWRNLQERMSRTQKEMQGAQELLSDLSAEATKAEQQATSTTSTSPLISTSNQRSSASTPSRSSLSAARNKVGDWLSPSPPSRQGLDSTPMDIGESPLHTRSVTPFRRLANRLHKSRISDALSSPAVPVSGTSSSSSAAAGSPEARRTPLSKGKVGLGYPTPTQSAPPMPRTVSSPATAEKQQRRYSRLPMSEVSSTPFMPPPRQLYVPSTSSERARSPLPLPARSSSSMGGAIGGRPPWNVGTRAPHSSDLGSSLPASAAAKGRKSMPLSGNVINSSARYSHITTTHSSNRPASRVFTTPSSSSFRPPSPARSATSSTSASATRPRPYSPNSRIPAPGSSGSISHPADRRLHEGSPPGADDVETLYFSQTQVDDNGATSLMQRALSPTPSQSGFSVTSSTAGTPGGSRRHSRIPRLSLGDSQPPDRRTLELPPTPRLPDAYAGSRSEIMTPEPALRSRAARVSAMYGRPSMSGRKSLGPGSLPPSSEYLSSPQPQRSLTASTSGMRPSSRLSVSTSGAGNGGVGGAGRRSSFYTPTTSSRLATPLPDMPDHTIPYYPNKHDPLDLEIADIVNSQPLYVFCQREDPHLSKAAAEAQAASDRMARYWLAQSDKPILCKLIDRGDRKPKKVLCKIAGEWQDLSIYLLNQQAQY